MPQLRAPALTKKARAERRCEDALKTAERVLAGTSLTDERSRELSEMYHARRTQPRGGLQQPIQLKAFNIGPEMQAHLLAASQLVAVSESRMIHVPSAADDATIVKAMDAVTQDCDLVLVEVHGDQLTKAERCVAAAAIMAGKPVAYVSEAPCGASVEAAAFMKGTWPACDSYTDLDIILQQLAPAVAFSQDLHADIQAKLDKYKQVDKVAHFAKRGAVALVPFGVHAVNFAGLMRIAKKVLAKTGVESDKEAKKRIAASSAETGAKVTAIDMSGDAYQLVVGGTILADAFAAGVGAAGGLAEGMAAAVDTVSVVDAALLGSICVVTGMVSAWGAAVTRPSMVTGMGCYIAAQQLITIVCPHAPPAHAVPSDQNLL
jgi:hypothetical protein